MSAAHVSTDSVKNFLVYSDIGSYGTHRHTCTEASFCQPYPKIWSPSSKIEARYLARSYFSCPQPIDIHYDIAA